MLTHPTEPSCKRVSISRCDADTDLPLTTPCRHPRMGPDSASQGPPSFPLLTPVLAPGLSYTLRGASSVSKIALSAIYLSRLSSVLRVILTLHMQVMLRSALHTPFSTSAKYTPRALNRCSRQRWPKHRNHVCRNKVTCIPTLSITHPLT